MKHKLFVIFFVLFSTVQADDRYLFVRIDPVTLEEALQLKWQKIFIHPNVHKGNVPVIDKSHNVFVHKNHLVFHTLSDLFAYYKVPAEQMIVFIVLKNEHSIVKMTEIHMEVPKSVFTMRLLYFKQFDYIIDDEDFLYINSVKLVDDQEMYSITTKRLINNYVEPPKVEVTK